MDAVGHVLASEDAAGEHLLGCELRLEIWMKVAPRGLCQLIDIALLHPIIDFNPSWLCRHNVPFLQNEMMMAPIFETIFSSSARQSKGDLYKVKRTKQG